MDVPTLSADRFPDFFRAVQTWDGSGWDASRQTFRPFPWQARLAAEIAERGRWPDLLDLPTGSGKTAAIDVAVFHLALEADRGGARTAAMRVAFVVDRRLVVDEAYLRAKRLAAALQDAAGNAGAPQVIRDVAMRLLALAGEGRPPLIARSLRGGVPREDDWALTPCQPTVLCSTVDQVGSRLLFRGYGVSDSMKPVQAGLIGSDALILLDEAHLSQPFRQTAQAIAGVPALRGPDSAPFQVALLTATPGESPAPREWRFKLGDEDREHEILRRRLSASKPAVLVAIRGGEEARAEAIAAETLDLIKALQKEGVPAPLVGVVANRVSCARAAFELLSKDLNGTADLMLVIGRARGVDRDRIARRLACIKTGEARPEKPCVVVATQTIEAGVDIDLDGLVTDAASLDALRQRFGRVNRDGRAFTAKGVIMADKADRSPKKEDPVYGGAIAATLSALFAEGAGAVDFGIVALDARLNDLEGAGTPIGPMLSDKADAPVLMPAYVDLWTRTSPISSVDPEPALFLHGPKREPASIQVVWRADFDEVLSTKDDAQSERLRFLLSLAPPRASEAIELPLWAVRRWLRGGTPDLADVDQADDESEGAGSNAPSPKGAVFCWRGADDDRSRVVEPNRLRRGDMIVVPSCYGGCDRYGWKPDGRDWVDDVYDQASAAYDGKRFVVRVSPGLIRQAMLTAAADDTPDDEASPDAQSLESKVERICAGLNAALEDPSTGAKRLAGSLIDLDLPADMKERLRRLVGDVRKGRLDQPAYPYGGEEGDRRGVVLTAPFGLKVGRGAIESGGVSTEDDGSSFTGQAQLLDEHSCEVQDKVSSFAKRAGLSDTLATDLALAGWLHDAGKADVRFQRLLYGGDLLEMETKGVLAKSEKGRSSPGGWSRAGLPDRWRHEALSVRLALENPRLDQARDRALVLWLVGTHHGQGRPFFPHADDWDAKERELAEVEGLAGSRLGPGAGPQSLAFVIPEEERFASRTGRDPAEDDLRGLDWATLFRDLKRRYGPWGLARLEATLRLADHRASEIARQGERRT